MDAECLDRDLIEAEVMRHIRRWHELLATRAVPDGRQLLRETLAGPPRMTPEGRAFRFEGEIVFERLLAGKADGATSLVPVRGFSKGWNISFAGTAA